MMYFMLKGLPFIYQGQELGMENCAFPSIEAIDDVSSRDEYQRCLKVGLNEEEALKVVSHYSRDTDVPHSSGMMRKTAVSPREPHG